MGVIVLDPGHGGSQNIGGSDWNHAQSPSGVMEKTLTLDVARRIRWSLTNGSGRERAAALGKSLDVFMTRDADVNLSLDDRAGKAAAYDADLYLSLHFNGWNGTVRGTEAYIDRKYMQAKTVLTAGRASPQEGPGVPSSGLRNLNVAADAAFAGAIVAAALSSMQAYDPKCKLRSARYTQAANGEAYVPPPGVKMAGLGALRDVKLGTSSNACRACLLELEFIDHPDVDRLFNGANGGDLRNALAGALAVALVEAL